MTDSPGRYINVKDSDLLIGKPIDDADILKIAGNSRHLQEVAMNSAAGETIQVFGHGHGELNGNSSDGFKKRRTIFSQSFRSGTDTYATWNSIGTASWTDLSIPIRTTVGPFKRIAIEIQYMVNANAVKFRAERWDWVDSGDATDDGGTYGTNALQEQTADKAATSMTWHTIDGQRWNATDAQFDGDDTKLMIISEPNSKTDLHEVGARCEIKLHAMASAGSTNLSIAAIDIFECMTFDEGVGQILT